MERDDYNPYDIYADIDREKFERQRRKDDDSKMRLQKTYFPKVPETEGLIRCGVTQEKEGINPPDEGNNLRGIKVAPEGIKRKKVTRKSLKKKRGRPRRWEIKDGINQA